MDSRAALRKTIHMDPSYYADRGSFGSLHPVPSLIRKSNSLLSWSASHKRKEDSNADISAIQKRVILTQLNLEKRDNIIRLFTSKENEQIVPEKVLKRGSCKHGKVYKKCKKCNKKDTDSSITEVAKVTAVTLPPIKYETTSADKVLLKACKKGDFKSVQVAIDAGANVECRDSNDWTPLVLCAYYGHSLLLDYLVEKGVNVEAKTKGGVTAMMWATSKGHTDCVKILLDKGALVKIGLPNDKLTGVRRKNKLVERHNWLSVATNGGSQCMQLILEKVANDHGKSKGAQETTAEAEAALDGDEAEAAQDGDEAEAAGGVEGEGEADLEAPVGEDD